jgi:hypothetical protein
MLTRHVLRCAVAHRASLAAPQPDVFAGEYSARRLADLKLRVVEHNVLTITKYYTRISTTRLAELLDLTPAEVRRRGTRGRGRGAVRERVRRHSACRTRLHRRAEGVTPHRAAAASAPVLLLTEATLVCGCARAG